MLIQTRLPGHERLDALPHLAGGLVGEGDGQDVARPHALLEQVGDAAGDDARLAAAGAGEDQQRALEVRDRLALGVGQVGEQVGLGRGHDGFPRGSRRGEGIMPDSTVALRIC